MSCEQLHHLLTSDGGTETSNENTEQLSDHVGTCPEYQQGRTQLVLAVIADDTLNQCRQCLLSSCKATRLDSPFVTMTNQEVRALLIPLSHSASCQNDSRFLAETVAQEAEDAGESESVSSSASTLLAEMH